MTATVHSARGQSTAPRFRPRHRDFDRCHLSPLRPRANSLRRRAALEDALRLRLGSVFGGAEASAYARNNAPESGSPGTYHRFCFIPASLPAAVSSFLVLKSRSRLQAVADAKKKRGLARFVRGGMGRLPMPLGDVPTRSPNSISTLAPARLGGSAGKGRMFRLVTA